MVIMEDDSDFPKVSRTTAFVDKSMFIKAVFDIGSSCLLITAPSRFGKTTNLDMLKYFLSNSKDERITAFDGFKDLNIFKNNKAFCKTNFRNHPVLYVSFSCRKLSSYEDAVASYRWAIHNAFLEHKYLLSDPRLESSERELCLDWCNIDNGYKLKEVTDIVYDLGSLVYILHRLCNQEVVLLIDDYDSVINKSVVRSLSDELVEQISNLTLGILKVLLRHNLNISQAVLTGVSMVATGGLFDINNFEFCPFLGRHTLGPFFGLTEKELNQLFEKDEFKNLSDNISIVKSYYGGYKHNNADPMYNLFSVLKYLKSKRFISHWKMSEHIDNLVACARFPQVARMINTFLLDSSESITFNSTLVWKDLITLKKAYSEKNPDYNQLFRHLIEQGVCSVANLLQSEYEFSQLFTNIVAIPNEEVKMIISLKFQAFVKKNCDFYLPPKRYKLFLVDMGVIRHPHWKTLFMETLK